MNGFAFCETEAKRQSRQHRFRLPDFTKCLIASNIRPKCEANSSHQFCQQMSPHDAPSLSAFSLYSIISGNGVQMRQSVAIICLCCICYVNALFCDFSFDDISAIKENQDLRPETPLNQLLLNDFWGQPMVKEYSHKSYRPVCVFTFRLNYVLHQLDPFGYHLTNVFLHVAVCLLYLRYCRLIVSSKCSFLASLLFSIHPIHTEAVTSVVGRAELLCSVFYLISLITYSRATEQRNTSESVSWYLYVLTVSILSGWSMLGISIGCICLATFSKEQGITAIALCGVYELVCNQKLHQFSVRSLCTYIGHKGILKASCPKWIKEMALRIGLLIMSALLMVLIRLRVMQSQLPVFTRFDNPAAYSPSPVRQMTHNYLFVLNAWLLLNPMDLCCDWTMGTIPLVQSFTDQRNLATVLFYLTLCALTWKALTTADGSDCAVILTSLSLIILPFLPASNLFFYVGFVIAERILYIPSFGFCLLVAFGVCKLFDCILQNAIARKATRFILSIAFFLVLISHCWRTILRNQDWKTEYNLFASGIRSNPRNAKLFNNVGHVLEAEQRYHEALEYFLNATHIQPDDLGAYLNVGRTYANLKKFDLAEQHFLKAKDLLPIAEAGHKGNFYARIAPSHLNLFINLGNLISQNNSRLAEAEQLYRQAILMRPDYVEAYINRAEILLKMNRTEEAESVYQTALRYDNRNPDIYYNLGVVAIETGNLHNAIVYFDKAIRINGNHQQALLNFAIVVQDAGREELFDIAEKRLMKLLRMGFANERVYFHLGMIAMRYKRHDEAEKWFTSAVQLQRHFRSATFNLALLLSNTNRPLEALPHLHRLVLYHPDHLKGLILLCDILINHAKDMAQAEICYDRILKLDPVNIQAKHNLCVVYVEQGQLDKAENCLLEVAQIVPRQDYVDRHLKIVRLRILKMRQIK